MLYMDYIMLDCIISLDDNKLHYTHCISLNKLTEKESFFLTIKSGKQIIKRNKSFDHKLVMRRNAIIAIV